MVFSRSTIAVLGQISFESFRPSTIVTFTICCPELLIDGWISKTNDGSPKSFPGCKRVLLSMAALVALRYSWVADV